MRPPPPPARAARIPHAAPHHARRSRVAGVPAELITNVYNGTDTTKFKRTPEMAEECLKRYPCATPEMQPDPPRARRPAA